MKRTRNVIMGFAGFALLIVAALAASTLVTSNQYPTRQTAHVTDSRCLTSSAKCARS